MHFAMPYAEVNISDMGSQTLRFLSSFNYFTTYEAVGSILVI